MTKFDDLAEEFPRKEIHWRAQVITKDGGKAMALAYIDARDVMRRLDAVIGTEWWQSEHYDAGNGKLGCKIGIYIKSGNDYGQWVWKSDGAGATAVEGDKGAFSDSFKRAAVSWGIGRYLYALEAPWVPCETYEKNGKKLWKKWKRDPWDFVEGHGDAVRKSMYPGGKTALKEAVAALIEDFRVAEDVDSLADLVGENEQVLNFSKVDFPDLHAQARKEYENRLREVKQFEGEHREKI